MKICRIIFLIFIVCGAKPSQAQDTLRTGDTVITPTDSTVRTDTVITAKDTIRHRLHTPRGAAIRSAILPGWGQVYNRKYWKVPIVYTAVGIPIGTFFYNKKWYTRTRDAAKMLGSDPPDTANYRQRVDKKLYLFFENPDRLGNLLTYRNEFRKNMDYSILLTLLFWGLNVVDATVDAHLRQFNVSEDLSMKVRPVLLPGTITPGVSVVFTIGRHSSPSNSTFSY